MHALLAADDGPQQCDDGHSVAHVVGEEKELARVAHQLESEVAHFLAHVLIETLAKGCSEPKEDAHAIDEQEGMPLVLARNSTEGDEREVPICVRVERPLHKRMQALEVLARSERDSSKNTQREVELIAGHQLQRWSHFLVARASNTLARRFSGEMVAAAPS